MKTEQFIKIRERIFKPLKDLNAEIRTIQNGQYNDHSSYWLVVVGMVESLGEQGYNHTFFYEEKPNEEAIIEDVKKHIKEQIKDLKGCILSGTNESHLKELLKIQI